jgi:hypothetical protein
MPLPGSTTFSTIEEVVGRSTQQEAGRSSQPVVASEIALQAGRRSAFSSGGATNRKSSSGGATSRKSSAGYHSTTTATGNHITTWRRPPNLCIAAASFAIEMVVVSCADQQDVPADRVADRSF